MYQVQEDAYLESRVYSASPEGLTQILYEAALDAVRQAREAAAANDIPTRARSISRASSCVLELVGSLNVEAGGVLGTRLASIYEYLLHELLQAAAHPESDSLTNCECILQPLLEGWTHAVEQLANQQITDNKQAAEQILHNDEDEETLQPSGTISISA